jgi:hypothetical protein
MLFRLAPASHGRLLVGPICQGIAAEYAATKARLQLI